MSDRETVVLFHELGGKSAGGNTDGESRFAPKLADGVVISATHDGYPFSSLLIRGI